MSRTSSDHQTTAKQYSLQRQVILLRSPQRGAANALKERQNNGGALPVCPQIPGIEDKQITMSTGDTMNKVNGGARRDRTDDLMLAKHALSQLSYGPSVFGPKGKKCDALADDWNNHREALSTPLMHHQPSGCAGRPLAGFPVTPAAKAARTHKPNNAEGHQIEDLVGRGGLEPPTSRLSGVRSNHLSYRPISEHGAQRPRSSGVAT